MNCGLCDKTDGMCYTSQPPQVKCTVTGELHLFSDKCNVIELFRKVKAERDAAVRDWEEHPNCEVCINYTGDSAETGLPLCEDYLWHRDLRDCFEWSGPQEEK